MSDTNVHRVVGNLLVGTSHFFVDTTTNRVGVNTSSPSASLDIATGDLKVGSGITLTSGGTITAANFSGNGSGLTQVNSDQGSWINGASSNIHLAVSTDKVGIGTVDPSNSLHIYKAAGEGTSGLLIEKASGDPGTKAALFFGVNNTNENPGVAKAAIFYERNLVNGRGDIKFCNDAANDANPVTTEAVDTRMIIKNSGEVGIGTVSPDEKLHVNGNIRLGGPQGTDEDASYYIKSAGQIHINSAADGTADDSYICLDLRAGQSGSNRSGIGICGAATSTTYQHIVFETTDTERMRINYDGNVGINRSDPACALDIAGEDVMIRGSTPSLNFSEGTNGMDGPFRIHYDGATQDDGNNFLAIQYGTNFTGTSLHCTLAGNVGVGTTAPSAIFEVVGGYTTSPIKKSAPSAPTNEYNFVLNGPRPGTTTHGATHFINGSTRNDDGGYNTYTIRNDSGQLRLGSGSYTTILEGNHLRMAQGDNSYFHFGPNGTWSGELYVGATPDKSSSAFKAQCISTNGNLHLDAGDGRETYINYYSGSITRVNNVLRMEGSVTEWLTMSGQLTHRYTNNTYSWGRWNGPHHFDLYSNTNFTQFNGSVNTVPFYINYYSHAPIRTANYTVISSDDRLKVNEKYIKNATQTLLKLKPQNYDKLACLEKDRVKGEEVWFKKESGLMTQDVYYDAPELRHLVLLPQDAEVPDEKPYVDDDPQKDPDYSMWGSEPAGLQYQGFIPYLIKSNQEIYEELQAKADMATLQAVIEQNQKLGARIAFLESALISS